MEIYTIGLTQTGAAGFFGALKRVRVRRLLDVRLNNTSQLAGFAKRDDLAFFLRELCGALYVHEPLLAPTRDMLDAYKKRKGSWEEYAALFIALLGERRIAERLEPESFVVPTVLLCSERSPEHCHRRLVAEYLRERWSGVEIVHL